MDLVKISETAQKITLGWTPVPGAVGYRFQSSTQAPKWSHTWDPSRSQVTFSKAEWYKVEALGVESAGEYPNSQPPPVGASLDRFTAFKNTAFGPDTAYPGSGAIFNRKCDPAPSGNGFLNQAVVCPRPWGDEWSGIFEVDIPGIGKGLDFRFGSVMPRSSGKGIQIADIGHLIPRSLPADFGFSWDFMFPAAGNPNGFPPFSGDPSTDEWNVLWEFTDAGFQSNAIGIANFVAPKPRLYVTAGNGVDNQKRRAKSSFLLAMDTWYSLRYEGRLSKGSDGRVKLQAGLRGQAMEMIADWSGPVSNPADGNPYIEFGLYGMNVAGRNQVIYANPRNLRG